jgi:hypothetical protein
VAEYVEERTNRKQAASTEKESFKATRSQQKVTVAENVEERTNRKQAASTEKESFKAKKLLKAAIAENVEEPTNRKQAASTEKESFKAHNAAMAENVEEPTITCRSSNVVVGVCLTHVLQLKRPRKTRLPQRR